MDDDYIQLSHMSQASWHIRQLMVGELRERESRTAGQLQGRALQREPARERAIGSKRETFPLAPPSHRKNIKCVCRHRLFLTFPSFQEAYMRMDMTAYVSA